MANKAAIDFGNCNTIAALWNEEKQCAETLLIPSACESGSVLIPSKIAYEPDGRFFVGYQIISQASADSKEFRWMKRYINLRSPYTLRVGEQRIDAKRAAEDFLHTLTAAVFAEAKEQPDELVISVPVESFEHYSDWLLGDMKRFENLHLRLVDEAAAAAAGYGLSLHPGDTMLVLDFGGSTLQAVCVSVMEEDGKDGRSCRVLGKAGCTIGGMTVDRWIYEDVLSHMQLSENDPEVHRVSAELLRYCEQIKIRLSDSESVIFDFIPERTFLLTREDLRSLLTAHELFDTLSKIIEEALRAAEDHGLVRDALTAVLPVGGSCLIPMVREYLESRFPVEKIVFGEPLGAVARGAAVIAGGMHIYDFIQHSYAIRYTDPRTGDYAYKTIVPKGTKYPKIHVPGMLRLKPSYEGQRQFGIAIYELTGSHVQMENKKEIFFDSDGSVHILPLTEAETHSEQRFWMNERNPLFLTAESPAEIGVPQFEFSFGIDANKMLLINAVDLLTNRQALKDHPVVRLV